MKSMKLRKAKNDSECCGVCRHFYDEGAYGDGLCAVHPEICAYCEQVCDKFEARPCYGDDESRPE